MMLIRWSRPATGTRPGDWPKPAPDSTAVRVALWRAMHVQVDAPPPVLEDEIGLQLASPDAGWRQRPDMDPQGTRGYRAGVIGRARTEEQITTGNISQYA